jgi:membrane protease YdiL (CAAX protease family)
MVSADVDMPLSPRAALRDTALAVALGVLFSVVPIVLWLVLSQETHAARWNPLADRTAWRLRQELDAAGEGVLLAEAAAWLQQEQIHAEVRVVEADGRRWLELMGPEAPVANRFGRQLLSEKGVWDGTVTMGGGRLDLLLEDAASGRLYGGALAVLLAFALGGMALAFLVVARRRTPQPLPRRDRSVLLWGLLGGAVLLAGAFGIDWLLRQVGLEQSEQPLLVAVSRMDGLVRVGFVLVVVVLAPVAEELFFRRHLFAGLRVSRGRLAAYGLSTALFAAVHLHPPAIPTYVFYGCGLAWLQEQTGRVGVPVVAHMTLNATATILLLT